MSDTSVVFAILAKDQASPTFSKIGSAAKTLLTGFLAFKGLEFAKDTIKSASDLNESVSKSQVIFGKGAAAVSKWADTADTSFGESKQQAIEAAATFGNFFEAMGIGQGKAQTMSTTMVKLAGDMASFNNADPAQVLEDIRSGLSGQVEPLRKYGVDLSDTTLKLEAQHEKMKIVGGTLTAAQKAQVAYALIMKQTTTAQGDFGRTSNGLANQQRIMAAEFDNVKAKLGTGLLPVLTKVGGELIKVIGFVQANTGWIGPLALGIAAIVIGIKVWTAAQWLLNFAMNANPIGLIIIGIVALVAVILFLWFHSAAFRKFFIGLWNDIWGFLKGVGHWFAHDFVDFFKNAWHWIQDKAIEFHNFIVNKFLSLVGFVTSIPGKIRSAAAGMWDGIKDAFRSAVNWLIGKWNGLQFRIPSISFLGFSTPGFTLGVPRIPYLASGGTITSGGLAMVGERGAEVVSLPTGSSVYPHGSAPTRTVYVAAGDAVTEAVFQSIRKKVRDVYGGSVQVALGGFN